VLNVKFDFDERKFRECVMDAARKAVEDKVRRTRCPEHHQTARIRFTGHGDNLKWSVKRCCEKLTDAVKAAFK